MDISSDILRKAGVNLSDRDERARRAVQVFRGMQPGLNSYARMLTKRRDVRIEMAVRDNGSTDGSRIFFRPPITLGDKVPHDKRLCDKRDERQQLLCKACLVREEVLVTIYHEIAHICYNSFEQTTDKDLAASTRRAVEETEGGYADKIMARINAAPSWKTASFIGLAAYISPWMPLLVNALEDARVNREAFKARKGTKKMFDASTWRIFTEGVEQLDPNTGEVVVVPWNKYPLNMQAIIGVFCKASGYNDYSSWFVEQVVEALDDEELTKIIARMDTVRSASGVYYLSFPVLKRLRELGFCRDESDPEDDPQPEPEPEEEPQEESGDETDDSGQPSDDDSSEESDDEEGSSSGEDDSSGDSSGDEGTGEEADVGSSGDRSEEQDGDPASDGEASDESEPGDDPASGEPDATDEDEGSDVDSGHGDSSGDDAEPSSSDEPDTDDSGDQSGEGDEVADDAETQEGSGSDSDGDSGSNESGEPEDEAGSDSTDLRDGSSEGSGRSESSEGELDGPDSDSTGSSGRSESDDSEANLNPSEVGGGESESSQPADDGEPEPVDTGADLGRGGIELVEDEANEDKPLEMGTPEDVKPLLLKWGDHDEVPASIHESEADDKALETAIVQSLYFETPSRNIEGVREARLQDGVDSEDYYNTWHSSVYDSEYQKIQQGVRLKDDDSFDPTEQLLGPALLRMRKAFADNERGKVLPNLKAGRVNPRVLGKRVYHDDPRLFRKKSLPGRRSYFVCIGVDVSGSTSGVNLILEKKAVLAQAELCARLGIDFAIYAHSGSPQGVTRRDGMRLDIYHVKSKEEPWDTSVKQRLRDLGPAAYNLDGHALEYLRKACDRSKATHKIILYYSDGKMPAENGAEEGEILRREIKVCRQKGYTLLGVGIRTDSPERHGLETVRVEEESDLIKVVTHLEKKLA